MTQRHTQKPSRQSRIPEGRIERLARLGWMAGEMVVGGLAESARRFAGGEGTSSVFLTNQNAQRLAKRLSGMRGAAMKLGQMMSLEGDDFLPPEFVEALTILRAQADAMPQAQLRRVLGHAYGKGWESNFREFEFEPVAAASIGQVHYAVTKKGRPLALKIQYPGVAKSIDSDIENLASLLRLSRLIPRDVDLSGILAEAKRQLRLETDYRHEAEQLQTYGTFLAGEEDFVVPGVSTELTTAHVLAMDFVPGQRLDEFVKGHPLQPVRDRVGRALYRLFLREMFDIRFLQSDPNFANYLFLPETGRIGLLDCGAARVVPEHLSDRYARLFLAGAENNRAALREITLEIGFFEADERSDRVEALLDLFLIGCEPFRHRGAYDFGRSDVPEKARQKGFDLTYRRGFLRPPPPEVLFLHRKLGGMFLLCARLGARVDVRSLLLEVLEERGRRLVRESSSGTATV